MGFVSLALGATLARDPTKVEPTHYKVAFENEWVQVVNIHYGPHEKSRMHGHSGGIVVVLTAGHLRFNDQHGKVQEVYANPGESHWFPPLKHKVENLGDTAYNGVYIGIKTKAASAEAGKGGVHPALGAETEKILVL